MAARARPRTQIHNGTVRARARRRSHTRPLAPSLTYAQGPSIFVFGGEVEPSDAGHEGAGGFADDLIAIDKSTGEPVALTTLSDARVGATPQLPPARGWGAATAVSPGKAVLFGGLTGDDSNPVRLDDLWLTSVKYNAARAW